MQHVRRLRHVSGAAVLVGLFFALPPLARADDTSTVAAATVLFDEGVKLMDAGRLADACPKLARSQALAPSGGTLLVLAECYEKTGRTASAWVAFREAAARAASAGKRDAEASALARASALQSKLPRLIVTVPTTSQITGLEVRRDGAIVSAAELGVPVPADPGPHEIEATAPHMKPFKKTVTAVAGETLDLAIPPLAPETVDSRPVEPVAVTAPPHEASSSSGGTQRAIGLTIGGIGVAGLIAGGVFGLLAKSKNDEALQPENCPTATRCTAQGLMLTDQANSRALVSTILVIVGGAATAGGALLFFTAPSGKGAGHTSGSSTTARSGSVSFTPAWSGGSLGGAVDLTW